MNVPACLSRPVFVVAATGAGVDEVVAALAASVHVRHVAHAQSAFAAVADFRAENRGWDSDRLTEQDAVPALVGQIVAGLGELIGDLPAGVRPLIPLDRGALQLGFVRRAFPDACFIVVQRAEEEAVSDALAAWRSGAAVTYPQLPGWNGTPWSLALVPQWRQLVDAPLETVVAEQHRLTARLLEEDLTGLAADRVLRIGYAALGAGQAILEAFVASPAPAADAPVPDRAAQIERFRSTATTSFATILEELGSSLLVSTYQTGKLVIARAREGRLNTHFRSFDNPMGMTYRDGRLLLGTRTHVWDYRNVPAMTGQLEPGHDACFMPRSAHVTGDIRIHDVAWAQGQLWAVATRFSCLATLDADNSFVPRWRPSFISALTAEDRCHLNGLCVVEDRVKYVTALGTTDAAGGWRERKADGGVIIDVETDEIVVDGLSMPHSPRWYRDRLWVLESGQGRLCRVDLDSGNVETIAELPGFTRGLAFAGRLAFVGLSEVREATTFGGLPLTARLEDRQCGVWLVDIETGETVARLQFEDLVQEIFDVALLPGLRFPEIAEPVSPLVLNGFVLPREALS